MIVDKKIIKDDDDELYKLIINEFYEIEKETKTVKPGPGPGKVEKEEEFDFSNEDIDAVEKYPDEPGEERPLLTDEEKKFIDDTVKWLKTKENKDAIISRIWDILVEGEPDSFYSPEQKKDKEVTTGQETDNIE